MFRQALILVTICCWNCRRTTIIATGQVIGKPRTRTPKHQTIQAATEQGVDTAAGASKHSLTCVLNSRESGYRRVSYRNKGERSGSGRIEQLNVDHHNKRESGFSRIKHLTPKNHRMTNTQPRVIAIRRESGDNRARLRSIVQRISNKARQEQIQPYLATQAETTALPMHNGECTQAAKRVDTATEDSAASNA